MSAITIGSSLKQTSDTWGFRQGGGSYRQRTWEGNRQAVVTAYNYWRFRTDTEDCSIDQEGEKCKLTVRTADLNAEIRYSVRLNTHRIQKDLLEYPLAGLEGGYGIWDPVTKMPDREELLDIRYMTENIAEDDPEEYESWSTGGQRLWELWTMGVRYKILYQPFLIKTAILDRDGTEFPGMEMGGSTDPFGNVGRLFSPAQIEAELALSNAVLFALPKDVSTFPRYSYAWLKHGYNIEPGAENMDVMTTEYEWGLWSQDMYLAATV